MPNGVPAGRLAKVDLSRQARGPSGSDNAARPGSRTDSRLSAERVGDKGQLANEFDQIVSHVVGFIVAKRRSAMLNRRD
eukprot:1253925-Alexandrium_andersonii.AAC.1